jgi:hypothetical protein
MFIHNVYFWFTSNATEAEKDAFVADCETLLKKIPTVRQIFVGPPVPADRPVVDASFSFGLTVIFDDPAGHDVYQVHPLHIEFGNRHKKSWGKIRVYDSVEKR